MDEDAGASKGAVTFTEIQVVSCGLAARNPAVPRGLTAATTVRMIAAGPQHCVALCVDGVAWGWGSNASGQLGRGRAGEGSSAVARVEGGSTTYAAAAVGYAHTLLLDTAGQVWACGSNLYAQLGLPGVERVKPVTVPTLVEGLATAGELDPRTGRWSGVAAIAAGARHSAAVCRIGDVYAWGTDTHGQVRPRGSVAARRAAPASVSAVVGEIRAMHVPAPVDEPQRVEVEGMESATGVACGPRWTRVWGVGPDGGAVDAAWGESEGEG